MATKSELNKVLIQKLYGDPGKYDMNLSYRLSQYIRRGYDSFKGAEVHLLSQAFDIWGNEFVRHLITITGWKSPLLILIFYYIFDYNLLLFLIHKK